jgi:hypothetical protein
MSISNRKQQSVLGLAAAALFSLGFVSLNSKAAAPTVAPKDTYEWSATLVSFDKASGTAVMQALVDSWTKIEGLANFKEGDKLTLVWTGREWAAGVRDLAANPKLMPGALTLPVEFVSSERDGEFVNFRIHVPANSVDKLSNIQPGQRVTAVSPKMAKDAMMAVISLHAYNDVG